MPTDSILAGLIGQGISASRSPAIHENEGAALGLRYVYKIIDFSALGLGAADLADTLKMARTLGFSGVNVTHPYKQTVLPLLDELSPEAEAIGAVNTVRLKGEKTIGYNTDAWGFGEGMRTLLSGAALDRVVQLGAGGAGAATSYAVLERGAKQLEISDVDPTRAQSLVDRLTARFPDRVIIVATDLQACVAAADGLINATPIGMHGHPGLPLPAGLLRPDLWVAEIVYFPLETELLACARALGCRTLNGGAMVVHQAAKAFEVFTGHKADVERMLKAF